MRKSLLAIPLMGIALAFAPASAVHADDTTDAAEATTIQWTQGWQNGVAEARKTGKLMFVYLGRTSPN
jgi:ABC-type glycerol-3-phosphate transport system substrate-binding protein